MKTKWRISGWNGSNMVKPKKHQRCAAAPDRSQGHLYRCGSSRAPAWQRRRRQVRWWSLLNHTALQSNHHRFAHIHPRVTKHGNGKCPFPFKIPLEENFPVPYTVHHSTTSKITRLYHLLSKWPSLSTDLIYHHPWFPSISKVRWKTKNMWTHHCKVIKKRIHINNNYSSWIIFCTNLALRLSNLSLDSRPTMSHHVPSCPTGHASSQDHLAKAFQVLLDGTGRQSTEAPRLEEPPERWKRPADLVIPCHPMSSRVCFGIPLVVTENVPFFCYGIRSGSISINFRYCSPSGSPVSRMLKLAP